MPQDKPFTTLSDVTAAIDRIHRKRGMGSRDNAFHDLFYGLNHSSIRNLVPANRDNHGIVFFTRPILNLTYDNLSRIRRFSTYRDAPEYSIPRAVRVLLDPWSQGCGYADGRGTNNIQLEGGKPPIIIGTEQDYYAPPSLSGLDYGGAGSVDCPLVDKRLPFISFLTNTLTSLSGWPDPTLDYVTGDKGIMGEEHIMADGVYDRYGSYNLEASFRTVDGHPHPLLFDLWESYMSYVKLNDMMPYPDMIAQREIDYMTRVYRFVLDPTRRYIRFSATTGAAFPVNNPLGQIANYEMEKVVNANGGENLSYSFLCTGAMYNDPIVFDEFNRLVALFNPGLQIVGYEGGASGVVNNIPKANVGASPSYVKLRPDEMLMGNFRSYPLINEITSELEWWLPISDYIEYFGKPSTKKYQGDFHA